MNIRYACNAGKCGTDGCVKETFVAGFEIEPGKSCCCSDKPLCNGGSFRKMEEAMKDAMEEAMEEEIKEESLRSR